MTSHVRLPAGFSGCCFAAVLLGAGVFGIACDDDNTLNTTDGGAGRGGDSANSGGSGGNATGGTGGNAVMCKMLCPDERSCCGSGCVNTNNDPFNCGACGRRCSEATMCAGGQCQATTCNINRTSCGAGPCCGSTCCGPGQLCCDVEGPVSGILQCHTPTTENPTCPQGCAPLCISDRVAKREITPVRGGELLDKLARLPISTWIYRDDPGGVRHIGPMAQDLQSAFGTGVDGKTYDPIDAHGIAFGAIKDLRDLVEAQRVQIETLKIQSARLAEEVAGLHRSLQPRR